MGQVQTKTGPSSSSHLHKGPALLSVAATLGWPQTGFQILGRDLACLGGPGGGNLFVVDDITSFSSKSSLPLSWWLPSRFSLPSLLSWPCCPLSQKFAKAATKKVAKK